MGTLTTIPQLPTPTGGLDDYFRAVDNIPPLSEGEEQELALRYSRDRDVDAARKMALAHLRLVVAIARGYSGYGIDQADLIQEGNIGLMKAVKKYRPDRGARLATFATYWIRAEIHEFVIRNWRMVKIATTKAQRKLFFHMGKLLKKEEKGAIVDAEAVAEELNVRAEDVREMRRRLHTTNTVEFNSNVDDGDGGRMGGAESTLAANPETSDPEQMLIAHAEQKFNLLNLSKAMDKLDARGREIIHARHLADERKTLQELAAHFGVSAERVRQLETQAMRVIRRELLQT